MRVRTLGADGPQVAAVGVGDVSLARAALRGVDAGEVTRALHEAIEAGIALIDVSGDAEPVAGEAVRMLRARDRVVIATRVASLRELAAQAEASLRATRLEVLPLVQLPIAQLPQRPREVASRADERADAAAVLARAELHGACEKLVREGKALRFAAWLDEPGDSLDGMVATSVPFNLCERTLPAGLVLARRPLAGGALAGALGPGVKLARTDDRRELAFEELAVGVARLAAYVKREPPAARSCDAAREQLEKNARPAHLECMTVAELALRWVIDRGAIALPRLHRREHIAEALAAAAAPPLSIEVPKLDI
jgi:aryl-alcohol dehydrogenase-like predicted oxidoreductase